MAHSTSPSRGARRTLTLYALNESLKKDKGILHARSRKGVRYSIVGLNLGGASMMLLHITYSGCITH